MLSDLHRLAFSVGSLDHSLKTKNWGPTAYVRFLLAMASLASIFFFFLTV